MRLKLLGPVELEYGIRRVDIGGPRQRIILSMLGLNANRVTPVHELIDAVWDSNPPHTARGQIQTCISALRKLNTEAGHPETIRTHPAGYLLEVPSTALDVQEFSGLIATARALAGEDRVAAAAATLRTALGLWRGPALAGLDSRPVRRQAELLEHRRMTAIEDRIRLDLALGWHRQIVGELSALVDENPLREQLCGFLMLALYRCGRQAEALEVHRRARRTLAAELGIQPGPELQELERAILHRSHVLDLPDHSPAPARTQEPADPAEAGVAAGPPPAPAVPHLLPASIADFTGRADLVDEVCRLAGPDTGYGLRIIAICGKPGVGKSSVAIRVAHELANRFPDGDLYADFRGRGGDRTWFLLARMLRALGVSGQALPGSVAERADLYRTILSGKRILVLLDDVTAEDDMLPLLPNSPGCTVIVTSRTRLSALPGAVHVEVDPLDAETSVELVAAIVGADRVNAERDAATELVRLCDRLPLALRIAGGRLASRPYWRIAELVRRLSVEHRTLDELAHRGVELRPVIHRSHRALPERAQRLFRLLALLDAPEFPGWTAAALLDTDPVAADDPLERLVDARMLDPVSYPGEQTWYRFDHLIRVYAREQLAQVDRAERDQALGRVLGAWLVLAERAHQQVCGGDPPVLRGTAARWRPAYPAAPAADPVEWWDAAHGALAAAVRQAAAAGLDEACWELALHLVALLETKGHVDQWREISALGLQATTRTGNRVGQAAMLHSLGRLHTFQRNLDDAQRSFVKSLAHFDVAGHAHGRAVVLRGLALLDGVRGEWQPMLSKYGEALRLTREVGDRVGEAQILRGVARFRIDEGALDAARGMLAEALAICRDVGSLRGEAQVLTEFAHLHLADDRVEQAEGAAHRTLLIARELGDRVGEAYALHSLGLVRRRQGRIEDAATALRHAVTIALQTGARSVESEALFALAEVDTGRGDHPAAVEHLKRALSVPGTTAPALWRAATRVLFAQAQVAVREMAQAAEELATVFSDKDSAAAAHPLSDVDRTALVPTQRGPRHP